MNFLYLTFVDLNNNSLIGVRTKINAQVLEFSKYSSECYYTFLDKNSLKLFKNNKKIYEVQYRDSLLKKMLKIRIYYNQIVKIIEKYDINVVYIRYFFSDPGFIWLLSKIKAKDIKIYIELPTYPYKGEISNHLKLIVDSISQYFLKKYVNKIITYSEDDDIFGIQTIKIGNGISLDTIPIKRLSAYKTTINLIGVANISLWHGYDRLIRGLNNYYNNGKSREIDVQFHIIGEGDELKNLQKLTYELSMDMHVSFYGIKTGIFLDEIFNIGHIGVGSLGNHRKGIFKESALKNREYCARGLPFITSSEDNDFNHDFKYIYRIEGNENDIDIESIIMFYQHIKGDDIIETMRMYAETNLSWARKIEPIVSDIFHE